MADAGPWDDFAVAEAEGDAPWEEYRTPPPNQQFTVQGADGKPITVTLPQSASDEEIRAAAVKASGNSIYSGSAVNRQTGEIERPEMGLGEAALRRAGLFGRDLLTGVGAIGDLVTAPVRALDSVDKIINPGRVGPDLGSPSAGLSGLADWLGLPKPESDMERASSAVTSGATAGLATLGLAAPFAATSPVAAAIAGTPGAQVVGGAGAGLGGELAQQSGAGPWGQFAGSLAGGVVPVAGGAAVTSAARNAAQGAGTVARQIISAITRDGAYDRAAGLLRNAMTGNADDVAETIAARPAPVEGVSPTLAEVAGDTGLAGFQRGQANIDPVTQAALAERGAANALARTKAANRALGDGNPQAVQDLARSELTAAERATAEQQAARQAEIDARIASEQEAATRATALAEEGLAVGRETVGPVVDRTATGSAARTAFDEAYQAAKARSREAYAAPDLQKPQPIEIPDTLYAKVRDAADDFYGDGGGIMPAPLQAIIADLAEPQATTRTLTNIDRRLADFAGEARMGGRQSEAAFAERIRGDLNAVAQAAAPKPYRDALANAKAVRAEQGRLFETGDAPKAFARDQYGNAAVGDTTVPSRIVRPGAPGGDTIDGLIAAIGPEAAETAARQELRRALEEGALETGAQVRALATKFGEVAGRFPTLRSDLEQLRTVAASLDDARSAETVAMRGRATREELAAVRENAALHDALMDSPLGRLADPNVDPVSFVRSLLTKQDGGIQLRRFNGQLGTNGEARAGLRRAIGEFITSEGRGPNFTAAGDQVPSISKTRQAIRTVLDRAGSILTREQQIALRQIERELENANFAATAAKPAGSETALNTSFRGLMERTPLLGKGLNLLRTVVGLFDNGDQVKSLITQAVLDPDFAATLLRRPTPKHWETVRTGLSKPAFSTTGVIALNPPAKAISQRIPEAANVSTPLAAENENDR